MTNSITTAFQARLDAPEILRFECGEVAMFSTPSPDKETPNEDACAIVPMADGTLVLVLADGAGGHVQGDAASRIAVEAVIGELSSADEQPLRVAVLNGYERAQVLLAESLPNAATTLVVVQIQKQSVRWYNVGDSGACIVGGRGKLKRQTLFHSPTGYAVEAGLLTETEALRHDERHLVSNMMGSEDMSVDVGSQVALAQHDTVVVASDGLYDNLLGEEIAALVSGGPLAVCATRLVAAATARMRATNTTRAGKPDDLTVLLFRQHRSSKSAGQT